MKTIFLFILILTSIALLLFIPLYFFWIKRTLFQNRRKSIAKRNGIEYVEQKNSPQIIEIPEIDKKINKSHGKRRSSMPIANNPNSLKNRHENYLGVNISRNRADSYDPTKNIEKIDVAEAPMAFGGFGVSNIPKNNDMQPNQRVKSHEVDDDNNENEDVSIELSVSIEKNEKAAENTSKGKTKGGNVSITFPDGFMGFARKVSDGVLKVLDLLEQDTECVICMEELEVEQEMAQLNCGHCFHKECVVDWLKNDPTCPFCRQDVKNYSKILNQQKS